MKALTLPGCLLFVLSFSCAHQQENKTETANEPVKTATPPPAEQNASADKSCNADSECDAKQLCIRNKCVDISLGLAECSQLRIHFDFDKADVKDEDKSGLERIGRCLRADQALKVTIEGNADERGTEEYNLALGDKRATVVSNYLQGLGASDAQLKTVSYGKENPLCTEHDEACWAKNRRAAVKPTEVAEGGKKKHKH